MIILKSHSKKESNKFIGAFLPQWIFGYFAIYTLAQGISKSELLRDILEKWIKETKQAVTDKEIINNIVYNIQKEWKQKCIDDKSASLSDFKTKLRAELKSRSIGQEYIESILKGCE